MNTPSTRSTALAATLVLASAVHALAEEPKLSIPRASPPATVKQQIGITDVEVVYNRPSAKGRQIFGALVPYDEIWRTGANAATTISFSTAVKVGGADVPAGTYELFTIPGRDAWTVIIHEHKSQWGSYAYDAANDVARLSVRPTPLSDAVETLSIGFGDMTPRSATLELAWEHVRVPVPLEVDVVGQLVPRIEEVMQGDGEKPYFRAAMFYYENGLDLAKAEKWMSAALEQRPDHLGMLYRLGLIRAKAGDKAGALDAAKRSMVSAAKAERELREEYIRLNEALIAKLEQ